jgi:hypothetical protein
MRKKKKKQNKKKKREEMKRVIKERIRNLHLQNKKKKAHKNFLLT